MESHALRKNSSSLFNPCQFRGEDLRLTTCGQNNRLKNKMNFNKLIGDGRPRILLLELQHLFSEIPICSYLPLWYTYQMLHADSLKINWCTLSNLSVFCIHSNQLLSSLFPKRSLSHSKIFSCIRSSKP